MKFLDKTLLIASLTVLTSCGYINSQLGLEDDNFGEEVIEEAIEMKTGLNLDLTPASPE